MQDREAEATGGLPELLAEYGRLVVELSKADPLQVERLRGRLAELDEAIDGWAAALETTRL